VVPTRRRRFFWAAWWSGPPVAEPFRKPDAASGGARSREEALAQAERAAGRTLVEIEGRWAGAWVRVLRGEPPWPKAREKATETRANAPERPRAGRAWALATLGLADGATEEEVKRAFRAAALRTHPDRGGDEAAFIEAKRAAETLAQTPRKKRRRR
jgi:hypothetical protein